MEWAEPKLHAVPTTSKLWLHRSSDGDESTPSFTHHPLGWYTHTHAHKNFITCICTCTCRLQGEVTVCRKLPWSCLYMQYYTINKVERQLNIIFSVFNMHNNYYITGPCTASLKGGLYIFVDQGEGGGGIVKGTLFICKLWELTVKCHWTAHLYW